MATYKQIQKYIKKKYGFTIKTCWIAHAKEICGFSLRTAPNRINLKNRTNPCPNNKINSIKDAFHYFRMI